MTQDLDLWTLHEHSQECASAYTFTYTPLCNLKIKQKWWLKSVFPCLSLLTSVFPIFLLVVLFLLILPQKFFSVTLFP